MQFNGTPVEVVVAALSTESSTMEELKWTYGLAVRAFILCTMRNTSDVCITGIRYLTQVSYILCGNAE